MENNMTCKGCGKPETQCACPDCPCKGGECGKPGVCPCGHHKVMPALVVLFGLVFLLQALGVLTGGSVAIIWPIIVILGGLAKLKGGMCGCYMKHY